MGSIIDHTRVPLTPHCKLRGGLGFKAINVRRFSMNNLMTHVIGLLRSIQAEDAGLKHGRVRNTHLMLEVADYL